MTVYIWLKCARIRRDERQKHLRYTVNVAITCLEPNDFYLKRFFYIINPKNTYKPSITLYNIYI